MVHSRLKIKLLFPPPSPTPPVPILSVLIKLLFYLCLKLSAALPYSLSYHHEPLLLRFYPSALKYSATGSTLTTPGPSTLASTVAESVVKGAGGLVRSSAVSCFALPPFGLLEGVFGDIEKRNVGMVFEMLPKQCHGCCAFCAGNFR